MGFLELGGLALLMLFIATRMRGLNNIVHECSHATFTTDRSDNVLMGKICASLLFNSFSVYRDEHLSHHKHIGDYEHDLDLQGIKNLGLHDKLTGPVVLRHLVTPLVLRHLPYYLSLNLSRSDGRAFQILQYALIGVVSVITALAPWTGLLMLIIPFVFVYSALMYWADCMDHAGLVPTDEDLEASRNLLAPKVLRWLFFPRNDCFHLVHHLFPHVPARHLEASHQALMEDRIYTAHGNAVRGLADMKPIKKPKLVVTPAE
ncbi:MAG: fatty acid desaturase [Silicimonas sp.]|nr:fatty acid desaturase [Silicimonas sp.]